VSLTATWTVPKAPKSIAGQTLYLFPGMEPISGNVVVQPVLTWAQGSWSIASWACCVNGNNSFSTVLPAKAGDTIVGRIEGANCSSSTGSCGTWTIMTVDQANGLPTVFVADTANGSGITPPLPWLVGGALEAWNLSSCDEYPASADVTFDNIGASSVFGSHLSAWTPVIPIETPSCTFRLASTDPSKVTISRANGSTLTLEKMAAEGARCLCGGRWPGCRMCSASAPDP
jgi:hypothetical protein